MYEPSESKKIRQSQNITKYFWKKSNLKRGSWNSAQVLINSFRHYWGNMLDYPEMLFLFSERD